MTAIDLVFAPEYVPPVQSARATKICARECVTGRRIRLALLTGPLAVKGQKHRRGLLVERCEEIPGADVKAVRATLRTLIESGLVRTDGAQYWRAA